MHCYALCCAVDPAIGQKASLQWGKLGQINKLRGVPPCFSSPFAAMILLFPSSPSPPRLLSLPSPIGITERRRRSGSVCRQYTVESPSPPRKSYLSILPTILHSFDFCRSDEYIHVYSPFNSPLLCPPCNSLIVGPRLQISQYRI